MFADDFGVGGVDLEEHGRSGSPGTRRSMKNTRVATAHMTTIAPKVRLKRYLLIGSP